MAVTDFPVFADIFKDPLTGSWAGFGIYLILGFSMGITVVRVAFRKDPDKAKSWVPLGGIMGAGAGLAMATFLPWVEVASEVILFGTLLLAVIGTFGLWNFFSERCKDIPPRGQTKPFLALGFTVLLMSICIWGLLYKIMGYGVLAADSRVGLIYSILSITVIVALFAVLASGAFALLNMWKPGSWIGLGPVGRGSRALWGAEEPAPVTPPAGTTPAGTTPSATPTAGGTTPPATPAAPTEAEVTAAESEFDTTVKDLKKGLKDLGGPPA